MPELNREEFDDVKFYHGTVHDIADEVRPADVHGGKTNWDVSKSESAYVTTSEEDAWRWAEDSAGQQVVRRDLLPPGEDPPVLRQRVYEVEPYGNIRPDRNLSGPQFETEGARVKRELPGPVNSQLSFFPDKDWARAFTKFETIAVQQANIADQRDMNARLEGGFQGVPQDTTLFDEDPEARARSRSGRLPYNANSVKTEDKALSHAYLQQSSDLAKERRIRGAQAAVRGQKLRLAMERASSTDPAPPLEETFRRL